MERMDWLEEFPGAITVTDAEGRILFMNRQAALNFEQEGGRSLVGKNILDCHQPASQEKIKRILKGGQPNVYTIEKQGKKKIIYQSVWAVDGRVGGLVELSLEIPQVLPHFIRD